MKNKPKSIVVLSGKGGTGKTTITTALTYFAKNNTIIDCDVDAADLFILLEPNNTNSELYYGSKKADIISDKCSCCGLCEELCRFEAISYFSIDKMSCEGCGLCYNACPYGAIKFESVPNGKVFSTVTKNNDPFYYAKLFPGEGSSGKLVSKIKEVASKSFTNKDWVIIDGPPGIGCPVNSSITNVDLALIVTEPTLSGLHDLTRLIELLTTFRIKSGVIINKYDLNLNITNEIEFVLQSKNIPLVGMLSYNYEVVEALQKKMTIYNYSEKLNSELNNIWKNLNNIIKVIK